MQKIYLVRHAKVDQQKPLFIGSGKAERLLEQYNYSPIESFDPELVRQQLPNKPALLLSSGLFRARQTAALVFPNDSIIPIPLFNEYQMGINQIPIIHMPYSAWTGLSRGLWLLHLNSEAETRHASRERMNEAALLLNQLADLNPIIILFGHGYFISELRKELNKQGWEVEKNGGNRNLSVSVLSRTINTTRQ